jgi:hypothetical protein
VPFIIYDPDTRYDLKDGRFGLANVAPTIVKMMGLEAPSCWGKQHDLNSDFRGRGFPRPFFLKIFRLYTPDTAIHSCAFHQNRLK